MSGPPTTLPVPPMPMRGAPVHFSQTATATQSSGLWDRVSTWATEHKAVVYTIAGVSVVVTAAGIAYYMTDSVRRVQSVTAHARYHCY